MRSSAPRLRRPATSSSSSAPDRPPRSVAGSNRPASKPSTSLRVRNLNEGLEALKVSFGRATVVLFENDLPDLYEE